MWVKFKKGHPEYAYFVGDVAELSDKVCEGEKGKDNGLLDLGYVVPATKDEIADAKKAIEEEAAAAEREQLAQGGVSATLSLVSDQRDEIATLKAELEALKALVSPKKSYPPGN